MEISSPKAGLSPRCTLASSEDNTMGKRRNWMNRTALWNPYLRGLLQQS